MLHWIKLPEKPKPRKVQQGDTKIVRTFLWWPFLHDDGEYYWLGFVTMYYRYEVNYIGMFTGIHYGWVAQRIVSF